MRIALWIIGIAVVLFIISLIHLSMVLRWEDEQSVGLRYYGLDANARDAFKRRLRFHAVLLAPLLALYGRMSKVDFRRVRITHHDVSLPAGSCDVASAARADTYGARPEDIFVATQMKCGTTWMENIVYEVLQRGNGTLETTGTALYAIAPWLEGRKSIPLEDSTLLGAERPSRIIKTHMPAHLCPTAPEARFIYVYRHPVSCFASCVDFIATNVGSMAPAMPAYEEWFQSDDLMWWGTWPTHVKGWWERSQRDANVLVVQFEAMTRDLPGTVRRVVDFLGVAPLSDAELARVVEKCGFKYMQKHQNLFEMQPPHVLQTNAKLFVRGTADRHKDVPAETRERILHWAASEMKDSNFPLAQAYPDMVG
ncbi:MAG: sulfotransferase domain-containing protein [bacterium]